MFGKTSLLLVIATSSFVSCGQTDNVEIAFYCSIPYAHFTVQLWESDTFSPDDMISEKKTYRLRLLDQHVEHASFHAILDGDETFSSAYTFYVTVSHNCVKGGKKVLNAKIHLQPPCPVGSTYCNYNVNVNLDNLQGERDIYPNTDEWIQKMAK